MPPSPSDIARTSRTLVAAAALGWCGPATAQAVDLAITDRIIEEGRGHSEVLATAETLADTIGSRLTNSPGMRQAEAWALDKFRALGLRNVHKEGFEFGRGWWVERASVRMLGPRALQLTAIPINWTPGTAGVLTAPITVAPIESEADFAKWRGKLTGRIVLVSASAKAYTPAPFSRLSDDELAKLDVYQAPRAKYGYGEVWAARERFARARDAFLKAEGALAYATMASMDGKLVQGDAFRYRIGDTPLLPGVEIAVEDYRRLVRLAQAGRAPTLEIETRVHYDDSDTRAYNILADISGTDPIAGYVMAGAHLDSGAAADGASDNGAGVAMVMEAARILATLPRPRRTIRFALWAGEEQGLLGSVAYAERHLASRGEADASLSPSVRAMGWGDRMPFLPLPGWSALSAYFNLDNGSGKTRGIYAENNIAVVPIFRAWLAPFAAMGATTVAIQRTGGTDHVAFNMAGVPGFQFIQDWTDYPRLHHSSMDTVDHLDAEDMRQGATILASFLWNAANADKALPRRAGIKR